MRALEAQLGEHGKREVKLREKTLDKSRPEPTQVLVQVTHAVVHRLGDGEKRLAGQGAGKVVAQGTAVTRCGSGDMVVFFTNDLLNHEACSQQILLDESQVAVKPHTLETCHATVAIEPGVLTYTAVHYKMRIQPGETVLITNPYSFLGQLATQLVAHHGAIPVLLLAPNEDHGDRFAPTAQLADLEMQCQHVTPLPFLDENTIPAKNVLVWREWCSKLSDQLLTCTSGLGFDHILDCGYPWIDSTASLNIELWHNLLCETLGMHASLTIDCTRTGGELPSSKFQVSRLAERGATMSYLNFSSWTMSPIRRDQLLHIFEDLLIKLDQNILSLHPLWQEISLNDAPSLLNGLHQNDCPVIIRL